tara:strand:+ start:158 stop:355 length:198 start_codon:yes stop_codon:yes gene_type:complete
VVDKTNEFVGLRNGTHVEVCELHGGDCIVTVRLEVNRERRKTLGIDESTKTTKQYFENRLKMEGD